MREHYVPHDASCSWWLVWWSSGCPREENREKGRFHLQVLSLSGQVAGLTEVPKGNKTTTLRISRWLPKLWLHCLRAVGSWASHLVPLSPSFPIFIRGIVKTPYQRGFANGVSTDILGEIILWCGGLSFAWQKCVEASLASGYWKASGTPTQWWQSKISPDTANCPWRIRLPLLESHCCK